jgi:hypothetical protein
MGFFVCQRVSNKLLDIKFISSKDQTVDGFTKALPVKNLDAFRHNLNLSSGSDQEGVLNNVITYYIVWSSTPSIYIRLCICHRRGFSYAI